MANITVTPNTLELVLTQHAPIVPDVAHIEHVTTNRLALTAWSPAIVISFPRIARGPSHTFSDEPSGRAMLIGDTASGYPVLNKVATFEPRIFTPELRSVIEANKLIVMAFYEINKDKVFPWYNKQDGETYEVCFAHEPRCHLDGRKDLWRINLTFVQSTP